MIYRNLFISASRHITESCRLSSVSLPMLLLCQPRIKAGDGGTVHISTHVTTNHGLAFIADLLLLEVDCEIDFISYLILSQKNYLSVNFGRNS
jgi:hypothetical protein